MRCVAGSGPPVSEDHSPAEVSPLLDDKIEDVARYINSQTHVQHETDELGLVGDAGGDRIVTLLHPTHYTVNMCRQVSLEGEAVGGEWGAGGEVMAGELTEEEGLALVAHLTQHTQRHGQHKLQMRTEESGVLLDGHMRLFNSHAMVSETEEATEDLSVLPLHDMKPVWYSNLQEERRADCVPSKADAGDSSPAQHKHSRKSLPHKKRLSRKLRRTPAHLLPCEEILPHSMDTRLHQSQTRAVFICQVCGEFYGEDQLKFYRHLKLHYEPPPPPPPPPHTIIIENPVQQMPLDKLDTQTTLADSLALAHNDKHVAYTHARAQYLHRPDSEDAVAFDTQTGEENDPYNHYAQERDSYAGERGYALDKDAESRHRQFVQRGCQDAYSCSRCEKTFRKQKHCDLHEQEAHVNKVDELSEFSEPEDLMEGIHVLVEGGETAGGGGAAGGPGAGAGGFLTIHNGHVHQEHSKHWYVRDEPEEDVCVGGEVEAGGVAGAGAGDTRYTDSMEMQQPLPVQLKQEILQHMLEAEVAPPAPAPASPPRAPPDKYYECQECARRFKHRNSLLYHLMSHDKTRRFKCTMCQKAYVSINSLKNHMRSHSGDKPYKCEVCGRGFRQWGDLKYHTASLHTPEKRFKCDYCSKEFARKYSLNIHIKIHTGDRNYKCAECGKTFRASSYRLAHMRTHTKERPFKCKTCGKCFRVAGDLGRHARTHNKPRARPAGAAPAPPPHLTISDVRSFAPPPPPADSTDFATLTHLYVPAHN